MSASFLAAAESRTVDAASASAPSWSLLDIFTAFDSTNNGYLTFTDIVSIFPGTLVDKVKAAIAFVKKHAFVKNMDADGKLSFEEFSAALKANAASCGTDEAVALANGGDNAAAQHYLLRQVPVEARAAAAKDNRAAWGGSSWCQRLAYALPYLDPTQAILQEMLEKGAYPTFDADELAVAKTKVDRTEAAAAVALAAVASAAEAVKAAAAADAERAAVERAEEARRWASLTNEEKEAAMACMGAGEAYSRG